MTARLHLDAASARPLLPEARRALDDASGLAWADPGRSHLEGRTAAELLERATATLAEELGAADTGVVWTSGGTEAVHLAVLGPLRAAALRGVPDRHLVVSAVEHSAVLAAAERAVADGLAELTVIGVDRAGRVDPDEVAAALRPDTLVVHVQHANHEVGTLQPTHEVAARCAQVGALLHVDACQSVGQLGVTLAQLGADLLSCSAPKFGGPRGCGALVTSPRARLAPLLEGDERQRGRRAGLPDVPAAAATAVALRTAAARAGPERSRREEVRRLLRTGLAEVGDVAVHGPLAEAHPGIVACSALYVAGDALAARLDEEGIAVSSGSSCATRSGAPSHVLVAMEALTHGHVRMSFTGELTSADAKRVLDVYAGVVAELRATPTARVPGPPRGGARPRGRG